MKRDFQEEYQNYIESDMPDLWSRIEPNLKEKGEKPEREETPKGEEKQEKDKKAKIIYFMKRAVPAAACLCALVIGIGVMRVSKSNSGMGLMESASETPNDTGMAYEYEPEEAEAAAEEAAGDESFEDMDDAMDESAAPAEAPARAAEDSNESAAEENQDEAVAADGLQNNSSKTDLSEGSAINQIETTESPANDIENAIEIQRAVLYKIAVASEEMQEMGYAYAYTFRLEDGSSLKVYLTEEQCSAMEDKGIEIKRKEAYSLSVYPFKNPGSNGNLEIGEGFLEKIEKLP